MSPQDRHFAVIDIGSNSVRMVVYHALTRVPMPLFNEKYYCGLASEMNETGKLHPDGIAMSKRAIARFMLMLERFNVTHSVAIATAAIRDASDGPEFVDMLHSEFGLKVDVIPGDEEAMLAAEGIIASTWHPNGLSADLGGGSLDLALIHDHKVRHTATLPLGTLRLAGMNGELDDTIRKALKQIKWLKNMDIPTIYAIGGSFRSIAKMHIRQSDYPLKLLHEYKLTARSIKRIAGEFSTMSEERIAALPGIPGKRAATMHPATLILHQLMQHCQSDQAVFSVAGIREGLLYHQLDDVQQRKDPLIASAEDLAQLMGRQGKYAQELFDWMTPLFPDETKERQRLRRALCLLSEIAWTIDPNFRAEWTYLRILQSDMKGMNHRERITLSMAMYHRHQQKWKKDFAEVSLIDEHDRLWAHCTGMAANLAFQLSGGQPNNLHHARLRVSDGELSLELDEEAYPLRTETVEKRLDGLGSSFSALSNFVI